MPQNHEVTLPNVVAERLLSVPDYQRPYAWGEKQLGDLWEDLDLLGPGNRHYAGTLVLKALPTARATDDGVELTPCELVDGQQRLTTCFILVDRVRRALLPFASENEDARRAAARLHDTYRYVRIQQVDVPRLKLGVDLNPFWVDSVLGDYAANAQVLISGQQRLRAAADYFDGRIGQLVEGVADDVAVRRLLDLQLRVTSGLRFLVYEVDSDAEVGVVFETLNERGRGLTELEKVKNYLLYLARQIPDGRQEDLAAYVNQSWSLIFGNISRLPTWIEEQLLRAHWLTTRNPDATKWKGITSVKAEFPRSKYVPGAARIAHTAPESTKDGADLWHELDVDVRSYVRTLRACSTFIAEMHNQQAEYVDFVSDQPRVRARTAALLRGPIVALFRPLLFAARLSRPTDGAFYADLVDLCETYSARVFAIVQRRGNAGEPALNRIARDLYKGEPADECLDRVRAVLWDYANDTQVREALFGDQDWYHRRAHKYFLYEYELSLVPSPGDVKPFEEFVDTGKRKTTEHVLPQNPEDGSTWWDAFSEDDHAVLVHTLGNLVLTYDNSSYGRKGFADKRGSQGQTSACFANASLRQERDLAVWNAWTPETIRERQRTVGQWALDHWAVTPPSASTVRAVDAQSEEEPAEVGD